MIVGREENVLFEGDKISAGVTHQIVVSGENSWVRYDATTSVQPGETSEQAKTRVVDHVNAKAMEMVHEVVNKIREVTG